ncbi:phage shock protein C (PspC) family protein [Nocardia caishijiensis]|uniref:Phage shock protein C (PspC) family protein n=2 Tax=Nocardia caishijiensis TaxID=184756 RepID=A0ABQ6YRH7_9NOCA|nr:phage shock protein C (PspC) family protein [Nocardia caishijiensis]
MWHTRPVRLPRQGPIAGVAAGFGLRYGIDPVLVRVAFVVSTIFGGAGIVLYLLAWLVLGSAGNEASAAESLSGRGSHSQTKTIVLIVALAIAVSTMGPVGLGLGGGGVISMGLMLAGWWMLYLRHPELPAGFDGYRAPLATTGYPGAGYPNAVYPYTPEGMYTPYTKLPDAYVPDPATTVLPRTENRAATTESMPLLRVDEAETMALRKSSDAARSSTTLGETAPAPETAVPFGSAATSEHTDAPPSTPIDTELEDAPKPDGFGATPTTDGGIQETPGAESREASAAVVDNREASAADAQPAPTADTTPTAGLASGDDRSIIDLAKPEPTSLSTVGDTATLPRSPGGPHLRAQVPPGWDPLAVAPLAWELPEAVPTFAPVAPPPPKRPRSRLTPITIGLAILAAAAAGAAAASGVEWMTPARIAAFALAVVGLGLVAGAFLRRGYGLLVLTAPLAGFVLLASLIGPIDFDNSGNVGDRVWAPTSVQELRPRYALDIGSGTLDLRGLTLTESRSVEVAVNIGDAKVHLPEGMTVNTTCDIRVADNPCDEGISGPNTPGAPVLDLRITMHLGDVEVTRG